MMSSWISETSAGQDRAQAINQYAQMHQSSLVYRSAQQSLPVPIPQGAAFSGWAQLGSSPLVSAPFTASSDNLAWIRVPLDYTGLASGSLSAQGVSYVAPTDVVVTIRPQGGTDIASRVIPAELLTAIASDLWPEPEGALLGPARAVTAGSATPLPGLTSVIGTAAGQWAVLTGGYSSGSLANRTIYTAPYLGSGSFGTWLAGSTAPSSNDLATIAYAPTQGVLCLVGGTDPIDAPVATASVSQVGAVGAWQQQASLPQYMSDCRLVVATVAGQDYLYVLGGSAGGSTVNTAYVGQIGSGGQITSWQSVTGVQQPGNVPVLNVLAAYADGALWAVSQSQSSSLLWRASLTNSLTDLDWQQLTVGQSGSDPPAALGVVGNDLVVITSASGPALQPQIMPVTPGGLGMLDWSYAGESLAVSQTTALTPIWIFADNQGEYSVITANAPSSPSAPSALWSAYPTTWVTVPLNFDVVSGDDYELTFSAPQATPIQGVNIGQGPSSPLAYLQFGPPSGYLLGLIEDGGDRVASLWYDYPLERLLTAAQWCGSTRSVQALTWTDNEISSVEEVA